MRAHAVQKMQVVGWSVPWIDAFVGDKQTMVHAYASG
jgi:hypothetical protein